MLARAHDARNIERMSDIRRYSVSAASTETFGRVQCMARHHEFLIDGPVQNGCPGEELTPAEAFLAGVAACGVELIQVLGKQGGHENVAVSAALYATLDRAHPVRTDFTVFNSVRMSIEISGVDREVAFELAEQFKKK